MAIRAPDGANNLSICRNDNSPSPELKPCLDLYKGYDTTPCPRPCETFHAQTKFVSELDAKDGNEMAIRMKFSPKVICV